MPVQQRIPWKRLTYEGAAIVISILLAFAIDAWWDDRADRQEEQRVLLGLQAELRQNLAIIDTELAYRRAVIASLLTMFDAASGKKELSVAEFDRVLGDVTWWTNVNYARGVVDGLVQSGKLPIIENEELRGIIAGLPNRYDVIGASERNDQITTNDLVIPFLNARTELTRIANTMTAGRPGTGASPVVPLYPVLEERDHRSLLADSEFLGVLVQEHWNHLEAVDAYALLVKRIESALSLIEEELHDAN